jgi:hypothetical protein
MRYPDASGDAEEQVRLPFKLFNARLNQQATMKANGLLA